MRLPLKTTGFVAAALALGSTPALAEHHEEAAEQTRIEKFAELPYWPGYWVSEKHQGTTIGGQAPERAEQLELGDIMPLSGVNAPWNEEGRRRQQEAWATLGGRKSLGWGYPMMMDTGTPLAFVITPELTVILNAYNETRYIYTDGRDLPDEYDIWPTTWGTSVGHWEGDTLVATTVMVKDPNEFFQASAALSEEAVYVERFHLEGDALEAEMTITDPVTLSEPWTISLRWVHDEGFDRMIQVDWDNDRTGNDGEMNTIELEKVN